jgi:hypothetical protein
MKKNYPFLILGILIPISFLLHSCHIKDSVQKAVDAFDNAITNLDSQVTNTTTTLDVESSNIQDVLKKLLNDLPSDVSNSIRGDVSNLLQRTVASTSGEFRCDVDFLRMRVRLELIEIKAKLLGKPLPTIEPNLCEVSPPAVDMSLSPRPNNIEFFGYDFDKMKSKITLISMTNSQDVTAKLNVLTPYHMILNLGGNGVNLDQNSEKLVLNWNNHDVSTICIIQPLTPVCKEPDLVSFTVSPIVYKPPRYGKGDSEFGGHGPEITCNASLINYHDHISVHIFMDAIETVKDFSEARGETEQVIYNAPPNMIIETIVTPSNAYFHYIDSNHTDDDLGSSGFIAKAVFVGDTEGDEVGTRTQVTLNFGNISIQLKEKGNCVSQATVRTLILKNMVSQKLMKRANLILP